MLGSPAPLTLNRTRGRPCGSLSAMVAVLSGGLADEHAPRAAEARAKRLHRLVPRATRRHFLDLILAIHERRDRRVRPVPDVQARRALPVRFFVHDPDELVLLELIEQQCRPCLGSGLRPGPIEDQPANFIAFGVVEDEARPLPPVRLAVFPSTTGAGARFLFEITNRSLPSASTMLIRSTSISPNL